MHTITLEKFKAYFKGAPCVGMGEDFFIMDVNLKDGFKPMAHPCRFDCFMVIYCLGGHVKLNVNLDEYELKSGMLFLSSPGNIIKINELIYSEGHDCRYICMMMSRDFVNNLMLDVNKILTRNHSFVEKPSIELDEVQKEILREHLSLIVQVVKNDRQFKLESVRSILSSVFYFLAGVWMEKIDQEDTSEDVVSSTRSRALADQFVKLVSEYHTEHRNVGFYAGKLCLTPKYLSRVIRDATGKSAPEWIDAYVILEAKNLLKYSSLAIKEIVYKLNFPNQSVFYKFFKARTGMTPSEYRNS